MISLFFSVVMPAYNAEGHIGDALASLDGQTFRDFEIVVVNDGSTDGTDKYLEAYASVHTEVTVINQQNTGPLVARRVGVAASTGEYILFLDADDEFVPEALEVIQRQVQKTQAEIVLFSFMSKNDNEVTFEDSDQFCIMSGLNDFAQLQEVVCEGLSSNLWSKCFKRTLFDDSDYTPFSGMRHGEDWFQLFPLVDAASSFSVIFDQLYVYNRGDQSGTSSFKHSQLADICLVCRRLWIYAAKWGGKCPHAAARGELLNYIYLVKISELSLSPNDEKRDVFKSVSAVMNDSGTFERCRNAALRIDNRLVVLALKYRLWSLAHFIVYVVESIKGRIR